MGVGFHTLPNEADGTLALEAIEGAIRQDDPHYARTGLVALENTQNNRHDPWQHCMKERSRTIRNPTAMPRQRCLLLSSALGSTYGVV